MPPNVKRPREGPSTAPADSSASPHQLFRALLKRRQARQVRSDQTYEDIIATLKKEGAVRRDWVPPRDPDLVREEHEAAVARDEAARDAATEGAVRIGNRTRTLIARPVAATGAASSSSSASAANSTSKYWYRWNTPPAGQSADQEYGPFGRTELDGWVAGGYFGAGGDGVSVRVEGKEGWLSWQEASG